MLAMLIKDYFINVSVNLKPIYLKEHYLGKISLMFWSTGKTT